MLKERNVLVRDIEKARKQAIQYWIIGLAVFVTVEALRGEYYWVKVKPEYNLFNYFSSLDYFITAEFAVLNAVLIHYYERLRNPGRYSWIWIPWALFGAAGTFFAADEMLEFHERLGLALERSYPNILRFFPAGGDTVVTASYTVIGLLFIIIFFRWMIHDRMSRMYSIIGFVIIAILATLDIIPKHIWINHVPFRETKEMIELLVGWVFGAAFISSAAFTLTGIIQTSRKFEDDAVQVGEMKDGAKA